MKIRPFVGVDDIILGMDKASVLDALGEPDDRSLRTYEEDGSSNEEWEYERLGLELTFSSVDDWRLGTISVTSPDAELGEHQLIGLDEGDFLEKLRQTGIGPIELEDDFTELGSKDYVCDGQALSFWVHEGKLTAITIYPKYDESGNVPLWPEHGES